MHALQLRQQSQHAEQPSWCQTAKNQSYTRSKLNMISMLIIQLQAMTNAIDTTEQPIKKHEAHKLFHSTCVQKHGNCIQST